jgi:D-alanine-D-alanine ligase-like ATP-grasp enzyme
MKHPFASLIINTLGPEMGIRVELEPEFSFAGELFFPDGSSHLFYNTSMNVNHAASAGIARDKNYTKYFLSKKGFNVPKGMTFFSESMCSRLSLQYRRGIGEIVEYAEKLGWPVFIKPNNASEGYLVYQAKDCIELLAAAEKILCDTDVLLVEESCPGKDYRVVVLDNEIIAAYQRKPFMISGDGYSSVDELIDIHIANTSYSGHSNVNITKSDNRIDYMLLKKGISRNTVLEKNTEVILLPNANLSTGGSALDVTEKIHQEFSNIACKASEAIGLRLAGVDLMCEDITLPAQEQVWNILEINDSPSMENFSLLGKIQSDRVLVLYSKILKTLENKK